VQQRSNRRDARKPLRPQVETDVLIECARRCCLCYGLEGDFSEKKGQIAHLDRDRTNNRKSNLAWLCQPHHDEYDTERRQTKGITITEVKRYQLELLGIVGSWRAANLPLHLRLSTPKVKSRNKKKVERLVGTIESLLAELRKGQGT
jgi:hypothetical protein